TFTAEVAPVAPGAGTPTGTVTFTFGDGSPAESATLVGGVAAVSHAYASTAGSPYTVTATYGGNGDFTGSSGTDTHTVGAAATTTQVTSSPDPSAVGQEVAVTVTVDPVIPTPGSPTGAVTIDFGDGGQSETVALVGGSVTVIHVYASTAGSPYTITAAYGGSSDYGSSSGTDTHTVTAAETELTLASAPDPSQVGQPVAFTAAVAPVAPGAGSPTGTVTFDFGDGGDAVTVPVVGGNATADHTYTSASGSPYLVTATYGGAADFAGSSVIDHHTVDATGTTAAVTTSPDPSVVGQPVDVTVAVAAQAPGAGTPTGEAVVDFGDGSPTETVTLVNGSAVVTHAYTGAAGSPYTVTATYGGNGDFTGSSGTDTHSVDVAATTTAVTSAPDPSVFGEPVTITATVTPTAPGAGTPGGTVFFDIGGGPVLDAPVVDGTATVVTDALTVGTHTITATYTGTANFGASVGNDTHTVGQAATTTEVTSDPDPSRPGEQVTASATVVANAPGGGTPTGTVAFDFGDGSAPIPAVVVGGTAAAAHVYTTTAGSPYTITAAYGGDSSHSGSAGTDPHVVAAADTTTALTASPDPSLVGEPVTASATVTANAPGGGTPAGTVAFDFGDGTTATATLVGGVATVEHTYTTTGGSPYSITADYLGNGDYTPSGATKAHTVLPAPTTLVVGSAPDPSVVNQTVTVTASVAGSPGTPTGDVVFDFGDGSPAATATLVGGVATVEHTYSTAGGSPYTITAVYEGNSDFTGSTGTDPHTVEQDATTVLVTSAPDPSVVGEPVTVKATVLPDTPGPLVPTGTVEFDFGDGGPPVTASLTDGAAEVLHAYTDAGGSPYAIHVTYAGDPDLSGALGSDTQTVQPAPATVEVASAPDPSLVGQPVTVTAAVTSASPGSGTPTGWVVFQFGDGVGNVAPLVDGAATIPYTYSSAAGSPYTITASYEGDPNHAGAVGTDSHTVQPASTTLSLASGPNPSVEGEAVTFTAIVTPDAPGTGTPTGAVLFDFGNGDLASATLSGGLATLSYAYPSAVGSPFTVSASYSGDGDFLESSATDTQQVEPAGP
ncbi:beta strand repeat-containing protein, partial [Streptomyces sp. NPDC057273]